MHSLIAIALVLGACGGGAYVEVHVNGLDVTEVELVTGVGECRTLDDKPCDSIQGDPAVGFRTSMGAPGDLYKRGPSGVANVSDDVATFELDPDKPVEVAFAIGRDIQGQVTAVAVVDHTIDDTSGPIVYRVDLDPAQDLFEGHDPGKAGVTQWGGTDHCIGVAPIRPSPHDPIFILPHDNPDCDGIAGDPMECNPLWFDGQQFDVNTALHCVVRSTRLGGTDSTPCVLGHQAACDELAQPGDGTMPCVETDSCLPDAVCDLGDGCADDNEMCQQQILLSTPGPRAKCIAAGVLTANGESQPCQPAVLNALGLASAINDPITKVEFIQPPLAGVFAPYHGQRSDKLQIGQVEFKLARSGAVLTIERTGIGPEGLTLDTILVVTAKAPDGKEHEVWLPITVGLSTANCGIGSAVPCTLDGGGDTEFVCAGGGA